MKATTTSPKLKTKVRPEPVVPYSDNPLFVKFYCAALTGLLSHRFTEFYQDIGEVSLDDKGELERMKRCAMQAWNAACYAIQEFEMDELNSKVDHE